MPYSKRAHTFRTADGNAPAARARLGSEPFVNFKEHSVVPSGFVRKMCLQHRPARVEDGLCHLRFRELGRAGVADRDKLIVADEFGRPLVKVMPSRIGDLGVDGADAALVTGALSDRKSGFVLPIVAKGRNARAVATCGERFQSKINADLSVSSGENVGNLALEADIPAATSVLDKTASFERALDIARLPKVELAFEVGDVRTVNFHGARNKRHPSKGALWAKARAPAKMPAICVALGGVFAADGLDGIGVQAEVSAAAGAEFNQVECGRPFSNAASFPPALSLTLDLVAVVPDLIARDGVASEMLADRRVFDPVLVSQNHSVYIVGLWTKSKHIDQADTVYLHFMCIWSLSQNTGVTCCRSQQSAILLRSSARSALTSMRNSSNATAKTTTFTCLSSIRRKYRSQSWSTASRASHRGGCVRIGLRFVAGTSKASSGRRPTSLRRAAGHQFQ